MYQTKANAVGNSNSFRIPSTKWFAGVPDPELAAIAAGVELKGGRDFPCRLSAKTVSIGGLGAVGGEAFTALARGGVGALYGFDFDRYERESWLTQPAAAHDRGRLKAAMQAERAYAATAGGAVWTAACHLQDIPWWVLRRSDALLVAGDNLDLVVWAGNMACALGVPLLQGAVDGETWTAFVRAYDFRDGNSACPACAFSDRDWSTLTSREGCDVGTLRAQGIEPTRTLPHVCRTAADLLAGETIKTLLEMEGALANEELSYCLLSHRMLRTRLQRNPDVYSQNERGNVVDVDDPPQATTLEGLAQSLKAQRNGRAGGHSLARLQVRGELPWIAFTLCAKCGRSVPVRRFGRPGVHLGGCACGAPLRATPVGVRSIIPADDLREVADKPLSKLRLPAGGAVGMSDEGGEQSATWFFVGPPPELKAQPLERGTKSPLLFMGEIE